MVARALAGRLDELGLWRNLPEAVRQESHAQVAAGVHPLSTEIAPTVLFFADGEDLAEGGVEEFLASIAPTVRTLNVELDVTTVLDPQLDGGYVVDINGEQVVIYRDLSDFDATDDTHPWIAATVRPLAAVNRQLQAAGATERFFTLHTGGNEGAALLIHPEIVDSLRAAGFDDPSDLPLLAE